MALANPIITGSLCVIHSHGAFFPLLHSITRKQYMAHKCCQAFRVSQLEMVISVAFVRIFSAFDLFKMLRRFGSKLVLCVHHGVPTHVEVASSHSSSTTT